MATYQSTYNETFAKGVNGMVANTEPYNSISVTAKSVINFGAPVFFGSTDHTGLSGTTFAATGTGSAASGNVGTGVITASPAITGQAKSGRYTAVLQGTSATASYLVFDPDGVNVGRGNVATANTTIPGITTFTITNAGTMTAGDTYYIDVAYTANGKFMGIAIRDPSVPALTSAPDQYPLQYTASVMDFGVIWVTCSGAVTRGGAVYWEPGTGLYTGAASATSVRIRNGEFYEAATSALVRIRVRRIPVTGA